MQIIIMALLHLLYILQYSSLLSFAMLNPIDFLALQLIRKSLHDMPGSNFFSSWDFTSDPCNFSGVYCDAGRVISLNLGDPRANSPGLIGHIHPAIGDLSSLAEFTVVPGKIYGTLPSTISMLHNLKFLGISRNYISGEIPPSLSQIRGIRTIDLSFNILTGKIPPAVAALPSLSNFIVCRNRLTGSIPRFTSQTLTRLDLKRNSLSGSISIDSLPSSLQYLSLSWNQLDGSLEKVLIRLNKLNYLDLSMNRFTGTIPGSLFSSPISNLLLHRNLFTGTIRPVHQVTIQTVDLSFNRLIGEISPLFSDVENLYLNNNMFGGEIPTGLINGVLDGRIHVLYVQHNYLSGMKMNPMAKIPVRSSVCLQYNCMVPPVQAACPVKAGIQKTRPMSQCV
ncbi:leucine-rich repeat receptor-like serine/threonine-protein kinase SKM1 [Impatiens glandulifera]|uniref:leucine-rich repeat receptor-like serine/threonine-protein kinase SKM1 n=1 Tax=Impatiens glandulifera TaxID=253017 RepID=UPI001FB08BB6|nr:leucine-rich repeat receptor-like serine/threonine-protein kinase SKM1 [Impatiens glandulifera]